MARATVVLPNRWVRFVSRYVRDHAYWYQPKGLAVTVEGVFDRLRILKEFESTKPWRECQPEYVRRLRDDGISSAQGAALARMLKQVMTVLGLAWIDASDLVEITPAGDAFLGSAARHEVLAKQALRYQFWNPAIGSRAHHPIRLHPVPFLVRLLQTLEQDLSFTEYNLFVSKARGLSEVDPVAEEIEAFRHLSPEQQSEVVRRCKAYLIGGAKRESIYNTIQLDRGYAYRMWLASELLETDENHRLKLRKSAIRGDVRSWLDDYATNGVYIEFANEKEFLAWMGDPSMRPDNQTALDIYTARGDVEAAAKAKRSLGASPAEVRNFRKMLISEKALEEAIEANFDEFSKNIGRKLKLVGRQYPTTVGPIDLLAQDRSTKQYVVIELKKGRSADKVFGQISRYMGWVRKNLAKGTEVAGIIVGSAIDDKLRSARDAHPSSNVDLVEYESRVSVRRV
jgi:hypothetical protein